VPSKISGRADRLSEAATFAAAVDLSADSFNRWSVPVAVPAAAPATPQQLPGPGAHLIGTGADDVLTGTAFADLIEDEWGDDVIDGGDGDDVILDTGGSNQIDGGLGNDLIRISNLALGTVHADLVRTDVVDAGDGDDEVDIGTYAHLRLDVGLGSGRDLLTFSGTFVIFDDDIRVTTGAGPDRIVFDWSYGNAIRATGATVLITDFQAGAGGDVLDLGAFVQGLLYANIATVAANPFASHHLLLIQDGADTIIRVDIDGAGPASSDAYIRDVARLANVTASSLIGYNFAGFDPLGAAPVHDSVTGTASAEWLYADMGGSNVSGLGGDDRLTGSAAADLLEGGDGNDTIEGGMGDDVLRGGDGDDILNDFAGNDLIEGGAGNDTIVIARRAVEPGSRPPLEHVTINAGDGEDFVSFQASADHFYGSAYAVAATINLGAGNDRIELPYLLVPGAQLTLGAGQDRVVFGIRYFTDHGYGDTEGLAPLLITDFAAGNGGDVLELDQVIAVSPGWNQVTNPFTAGYLFLQQSGADTLVQWEYDGSGPQTNVYTVAQLANVSAASLTAYNFGGYAPNGAASVYTVISGGAGNDVLYGGNGSDTIDGGAGNDRIEDLKHGSDVISGGDGDDIIIVSHSNSSPAETVRINGGADNDYVEFGDSDGTLIVDLGTGNDRLRLMSAVNLGSFITLGAGADVLVIDGHISVSARGPITVTDFATGAGGDRLDWSYYAELALFNGDQDFNPFVTEDARLIQAGADTLLQINLAAGTVASPNYGTLVTFQNTSVAAFTPYNIGYLTYLTTHAGNDGNDTLTGTGGVDVIAGYGGDDHLDGLGGDDLIRGGDGADTMIGGAGNDRLTGGAGDDNLSGGDDADYLDGGSGRDVVDGGDGNDTIFDWFGSDSISGGKGNDFITVKVGADPGAGGVPGTTGSISAGDGNDVVTLDNLSGGASHHIIDLGAGDDRIYLRHAVDSLILGSGRDTVAYATPNRLHGALVISDFTPGDSGDNFDLVTLLAGPLAFSSGVNLIPLGLDPFALGYVELRQAGVDVELYIYPGGTNDDSIYTNIPSARFLNTTIAQFTAANFGGFDPHAVPNRATVLDHDLTVGAGQTLAAVDVTPVQVLGLSGFSTHFLFRNLTSPADFVNHGTITSRLTQGAFGPLAGIVVDTGFCAGGSFVNAADGQFIVNSIFADESGDLRFGDTYGFYASSLAVEFRNDGHFEVNGMSGMVHGVLTGYDVSRRPPTTNNGTFIVTSAYDAIGFELGHSTMFTNTGTITVSAERSAIGVLMNDYHLSQFDNSGTIIVSTAPNSPYASIGVAISHGEGTQFDYVNSGTIIADIAFYSTDGDFPADDNRDNFVNSGLIDGDMLMGDGADRLTNFGSITGYADLGLGADVYDGTAGLYSGIVDGGGGDDMLLGSRSGETLLGNRGNDRIYGAGGGDVLDGGRGSDALDGGDGFDIITYVDAWKGVSVDFAQGIADGDGIDRFRNVEGVVGSAYADTLTGAGGADYLEGAGGDDSISGGGGGDIILGDTGDDLLTGGAGADVFTVSTGDGADTITDFNPLEDRLDIHGFAAAAQIQQVGADTLVTLAVGQSVLLKNVQASSLTGGRLAFDPLPLGPAPVPAPLGTQIEREGFRLYAGETLHVVNPDTIFPWGDYLIRNTAVDSYLDTGTTSAIVAGSLILEVAGSDGIAKGLFLPAEVSVLDTGRIEVLTSGAVSALGIFGGTLFNAGHVRVVSTNTSAPVLDRYETSFTRPELAASSATGVFNDRTDSIFINNGTIEVSSGRVSSGVLSYNNNGGGGFWNSGDILVTGGLGSLGVLLQGQGHPASAQRPTFVNSGDIVITDATTAPDSVGLALSISTIGGGGPPVNVWNSGLIQADYAIKWLVSITPDSGGVANIYNSGELRGLVDLSADAESLYNRGLITGRIDLRGGNDLFDGRGGTQAAGVYAGDGSDSLFGGGGVDLLDGGAGDDLVDGGGGNDLLTGGAGNDVFHVEAGFGIDTITDFTAGTSEDSVRVSGYSAYQSAQQQGADTLVTFSATDKLLLKNVVAANLTALDFVFSAAPLAAATLPAAPVQPIEIDYQIAFDPAPAFAPVPPLILNGTPGNDTLTGSDGPDVLNGLGGADQMIGKAGDDTYYVDNAGDVIVEFPGDGLDYVVASISYALNAGASVELLGTTSNAGTADIDLTGNELTQTIIGNAGANTLRGGPGGADILAGLAGNDTYFADADDQVREDVGAGFDYVVASGTYTLNFGAEIELLGTTNNAGTAAIDLTGNNFAQVIIGNAGMNSLRGGPGGGDVLVGFGGDDTYFVDGDDQVREDVGGGFDYVVTTTSYALNFGAEIELLGTTDNAGTDAIDLTGNNFAQVIIGNAGMNSLRGGPGGGDVLVGFGGDDTYFVDADDQVREDAGGGFDYVVASSDYALNFGAEIELLGTVDNAGLGNFTLTGNNFTQIIIGNAGDNVLNGGGGGADILNGLAGNDTLFVDADDIVREEVGNGYDYVVVKSSYALNAGAEIELMTTTDNAGTSAFNLTGNEFANIIQGNAGANVLNGGLGADRLVGLGGADSFAFTTTLGNGNVDTLTDFAHGTDKILLDHAVFAGLSAGALGAGAFVTGSAAADGDDRIIYNSTTGALFFDADGSGSGAAVQFATLQPGLGLGAADFQVI
jgi:Ca2+-binding RTX toxin-like protein